MFGLSLQDTGIVSKNEIISTCEIAMHISTIGYMFMGFSVAIQGILQGLRNIYKPIIISLLRLILFVVPFEFLFINIGNTTIMFWMTFPIAEVRTAIISYFLLRDSLKKQVLI